MPTKIEGHTKLSTFSVWIFDWERIHLSKNKFKHKLYVFWRSVFFFCFVRWLRNGWFCKWTIFFTISLLLPLSYFISYVFAGWHLQNLITYWSPWCLQNNGKSFIQHTQFIENKGNISFFCILLYAENSINLTWSFK